MTERIFSLMFFVADNLESKSGENPFANSQTVSDLLLSGQRCFWDVQLCFTFEKERKKDRERKRERDAQECFRDA